MSPLVGSNCAAAGWGLSHEDLQKRRMFCCFAFVIQDVADAAGCLPLVTIPTLSVEINFFSRFYVGKAKSGRENDTGRRIQPPICLYVDINLTSSVLRKDHYDILTMCSVRFDARELMGYSSLTSEGGVAAHRDIRPVGRAYISDSSEAATIKAGRAAMMVAIGLDFIPNFSTRKSRNILLLPAAHCRQI